MCLVLWMNQPSRWTMQSLTTKGKMTAPPTNDLETEQRNWTSKFLENLNHVFLKIIISFLIVPCKIMYFSILCNYCYMSLCIYVHVLSSCISFWLAFINFQYFYHVLANNNIFQTNQRTLFILKTTYVQSHRSNWSARKKLKSLFYL